MSDYDRLLACGFSQQMAHDILIIFTGDPEELEAYIRRAEFVADV